MELISKEYATALFELSLEQQNSEKVMQELSLISNAFNENEEYKKLLSLPTLQKSEKKAIIEKTFTHISEVVKHFIYVLIDNNRLDCVEDIKQSFERLIHEYNKEVVVEVKSAISLSDNEIKKITEVLEKKHKKRIVINNIVDKSLIGGLSFKIGNDVFDSTIASKLKQLEKHLIK